MPDRNLILCPICGFESWTEKEDENHVCVLLLSKVDLELVNQGQKLITKINTSMHLGHQL